MTKVLAYTQPHHAARLYDELIGAVPSLAPSNGVANLLLASDGADALQLTVPDATDALLIDPVLAAHDPTPDPPPVTAYAQQTTVDGIVRTTDATPVEVFRFPCEQGSLYRANLRISGIDAGTFAVKIMEGRFVWKRLLGNALVTGIEVISDLHDTAAATWAPNCLPSGTDIVFTVQGASGRIIDWLLVGEIGIYRPEGLV